MNWRVIEGLLFAEPCVLLAIPALIPFCYTFIRFLQDSRAQVRPTYLQPLSLYYTSRNESQLEWADPVPFQDKSPAR